ncbi:MAG: TIM barrel protein [Candidatus Glassbacteria bacterium]|nr:TIM barrel protein [Candidatus Glassbacteria bacterium]
MAELLFGTGGVPHSAKDSSVLSGIRRISELGLGNLEVEFVHGVRTGEEKCRLYGETARKLGVALTCHGPYYINLNSAEPEKKEASIKRVLNTARAAHWMGAESFTFHAAFFMKQDPEQVYGVVRRAVEGILEEMAREGIDSAKLSPELTGKATQWGSLEELIRICRDLDGVHPCIDFAHNHARSGGEENSYEEFCATLEAISSGLGREYLDRLHIHVSGIEYSAKGERRHLVLTESDLKYKELLQALKEFGVGGTVVCESPNLEQDAALMKAAYEKLR